MRSFYIFGDKPRESKPNQEAKKFTTGPGSYFQTRDLVNSLTRAKVKK